MKKFFIIWLGEFISSIGTGMTSFALSVYVYQEFGSAAAVSLVTLLAYLPTILLNPIGGVLADRFDRRLLMICGDLFSAFGLIFILLNAQMGTLSVLTICIGVTISSIFVSLLDPAYKATITDLLDEDEYAKASGMVQIASSAKYLISPTLAGFILAFADIRLILLIDICTVVITVAATLFVRRNTQSKPVTEKGFNLFKNLAEGWNAVTKNRGILILVILMAFVCFNVGFLQTLLSPMVLSFTDSKTLGMIESVSAIGMLLGSIVIGIFSIKKNYSRILAVALFISGIFMAAIGVTTNVIFIITAGVLFFMSLPFVNTCADTLARLNIPNEIQGRAWGIIGILSQLGYVIAYAICGVLADNVFTPMLLEDGILANSIGNLIGVGEGRGIGLMLIVCGILIIVVAIILININSLRKMEKSEQS
ncbi:MAG: MFS transporter [Acutalibacteraceae bacterium]|nr:MFS transporter [Acutalibacteraceae bacterium]